MPCKPRISIFFKNKVILFSDEIKNKFKQKNFSFHHVSLFTPLQLFLFNRQRISLEGN